MGQAPHLFIHTPPVGKSKDFYPGIAIFQSHDRLLNQTTIPNRPVYGKFAVRLSRNH